MSPSLAPGYEVTVGDRGLASPDPGDVSSLFIATFAEKGPANTPTVVRSHAQWRSVFGGKVAWSDTDRGVEAFFREEGKRLVVSRAVGPTPTVGFLMLQNTTPADVLKISALGPGAYSSAYKVTVTTEASDRRIKITKGTETLLDAVYSSSVAAKAGIDATGELVASVEAGTWPVANLAETALSAGTDDNANITTAQWTAALSAMGRDLGSGQVAVPGITTEAVRLALHAHANATNRCAIAALADVSSVSTLKAAMASSRALGKDGARSIILAGWEQVVIDGATVAIPPECSVAGRIARVDGTALEGPAQPAAGEFAVSRWSTGVTQTWTEAQREELNEAGIAVIVQRNSGVQLYGYRTPVDPVTLPQYVEFSGMRVLMAIVAESEAILSQFVLRNIDGNRHILADLNGSLSGNMNAWYKRRALFGETPADAFEVDTGVGINPNSQLAQRKIKAQGYVRTTPFAERVEFTITKVASADTI